MGRLSTAVQCTPTLQWSPTTRILNRLSRWSLQLCRFRRKARKEEITKHFLVGRMVDLPAGSLLFPLPFSPPPSPSLLFLVLIIGSARDRKSGLKFDLAEVVAGRRGAGGSGTGRPLPASLVPPLLYTFLPPLSGTVYSHFNGQTCLVFLPIQIPVNRGRISTHLQDRIT